MLGIAHRLIGSAVRQTSVAPAWIPAARRTTLNLMRAYSTEEVEFEGLEGTKTHDNLKHAFAAEAMAAKRYTYYAQKADVEGLSDVAAVFRSIAEGETGHALGHMEFLEEVGDPATGELIGPTLYNLKSSIAGEKYDYTELYPNMAQVAREEGFEEVAVWFETLAQAEKNHETRLQKALNQLETEQA